MGAQGLNAFTPWPPTDGYVLVPQVSPPSDQHHLGAGFVQGAGDGRTEPVAASGDQRRTPGQTHESAIAADLFSAASIHSWVSPR